MLGISPTFMGDIPGYAPFIEKKGVVMETELEERIQRLEDIEEIKQLKSSYVYRLDEKDWDRFLDCFTDDCHSTPNSSPAAPSSSLGSDKSQFGNRCPWSAIHFRQNL